MEECRSPEKAWWVLLKAKVSQKAALHCFTACILVQAAVIPKVRVWTQGLNITHLGHLSTVKSQHRVHLRVQRKAASSWRRRIRRLAVLIISNTGGQRGHGSCLNIKVWDSGRMHITWNLCFQPCTHSLLPKVGADGCTQLFSSPCTHSVWNCQGRKLETNPSCSFTFQDAKADLYPQFHGSYFCCTDAFYTHTPLSLTLSLSPPTSRGTSSGSNSHANSSG